MSMLQNQSVEMRTLIAYYIVEFKKHMNIQSKYDMDVLRNVEIFINLLYVLNILQIIS